MSESEVVQRARTTTERPVVLIQSVSSPFFNEHDGKQGVNSLTCASRASCWCLLQYLRVYVHTDMLLFRVSGGSSDPGSHKRPEHAGSIPGGCFVYSFLSST